MNARALWLILAVASPVLAFPSHKVVRPLHLLEAGDSYLGLVAPPAAAPAEVSLAGKLELSRELALAVPAPLDDGGGAGSAIRSDLKPVVALLVSLIVGFGLGHLVAQDRDGFVLWLLVDVVIVVASSIIHVAVAPLWFLGFYGLGSLVLLISHVIQALDVYPKAGGTKLVERARDRSILVSSAGRPDPVWPGAVQLMAASF